MNDSYSDDWMNVWVTISNVGSADPLIVASGHRTMNSWNGDASYASWRMTKRSEMFQFTAYKRHCFVEIVGGAKIKEVTGGEKLSETTCMLDFSAGNTRDSHAIRLDD